MAPPLVTKSQKPRPNTGPELIRRSRLALRFQRSQRTSPASAQRSQQTPLARLRSRSPARRPLSAKEPVASRPSDVASARDCPRAKLGLQPSQLRLPAKNYLQFLALKSLQPWPQLWPSALKVVTVGQSSSVRSPSA